MSMKITVPAGLALLLSGLVVATSAEVAANDFRGSSWGDSKADVEELVSAPVVTSDDTMLVYKGDLAGLNIAIVYSFFDDRLAEAAYMSQEQHLNKNEYIEDYEKLKSLLEKKYGEPTNEEVVWRDDSYKDDPSHYGLAVSMGDLVYRTEWNSGTTRVVTALRGDNFDVSHGVAYSELASEQTRDAKQETETLEQL